MDRKRTREEELEQILPSKQQKITQISTDIKLMVEDISSHLLSKFSPEVLVHVFSFVKDAEPRSMADLIAISQTCTKWRDIIVTHLHQFLPRDRYHKEAKILLEEAQSSNECMPEAEDDNTGDDIRAAEFHYKKNCPNQALIIKRCLSSYEPKNQIGLLLQEGVFLKGASCQAVWDLIGNTWKVTILKISSRNH